MLSKGGDLNRFFNSLMLKALSKIIINMMANKVQKVQ